MVSPASIFAQSRPPVEVEDLLPPTRPCQVDELLPHIAAHVRELLHNVNRFTATEILERERLDNDGKIKEKAYSRSNYIAMIEETKPGLFSVQEMHAETQGQRSFYGTIQANVAPALVLIFHPSYSDEFNMTCAGEVDWHGHPTWEVRFEQRKDRPNTMTDFQVDNRQFTILLKGSAWIDSSNYQILHLETDLLEPIPDIRLASLHQSVDYGPVSFSRRHTTLWLPREADVAADFRGKHLVERHRYRDFQLFSVETGQKISEPVETPN
jgi:hypothetical protein